VPIAAISTLEGHLDSERINRWLTLGANVGVLIGIVLLIIELDQNRDMMRAQIRNELSIGVQELVRPALVDQDLADLLIRAGTGESLSPAESFRVGIWDQSIFRYWENVHYQYRQGLYEESEYLPHIDAMLDVLAENPRMHSLWCKDRQIFSGPFMEFMDNLLDGPDC
jgi:hypothetical protein